MKQAWRKGDLPVPKPPPRIIGNADCIEFGHQIGFGGVRGGLGIGGLGLNPDLLFGIDRACWTKVPLYGGIKFGGSGRRQVIQGGVRFGGQGGHGGGQVIYGGLGLGGAGRFQVIYGGIKFDGGSILGRGGLKFGGVPPAAPQRIQFLTSVAQGAPPQTLVGSWTPPTIAGHWLFAAIGAKGTTGAPTLTAPTGWSLADNHTFGHDAVWLYYRKNTPSQTNVGVWTLSGAVGTIYAGGAFEEWSGLAATGSLDAFAKASGHSANPATGTTGSLASAVELAVGAIDADTIGNLSSPTNGFALVATTGGNAATAMLTLVTSSTSPVTTSVTSSIGAVDWCGCIVTFKTS